MKIVDRNVVTTFYSGITADGSYVLKEKHNDRSFSSSGIEAGGRIVSSGITGGTLVLSDATGVELYNGGISASATIDPVPRGVLGPLTAVVSGLTHGGDPALTIYWSVRK